MQLGRTGQLGIFRILQRQHQMQVERPGPAQFEFGQRIGLSDADRALAHELHQARAAAAALHIEIQQALMEIRDQRHGMVHLDAQRRGPRRPRPACRC